MSTTYTQSTHNGSIVGRGGLAFLFTAAIFALIPILQIFPNLMTGFIDPTLSNTAKEIAPIVQKLTPVVKTFALIGQKLIPGAPIVKKNAPTVQNVVL